LGRVRIKGIVFAGTATPARPQMSAFVETVLGLSRIQVDGVEADLFAFPDGSTFAVASPDGMGPTERTLGFLVDDLAAAADELRRAGIETDADISHNASQRYLHFRAPDGNLYELVEALDP
jgi:catechol 2,3-dioxygenase-like lactoylglutathione lyase family enzyme